MVHTSSLIKDPSSSFFANHRPHGKLYVCCSLLSNIVMFSRNHPLLMYLLSCQTRTLVSAPDKNNYNIVMLSRNHPLLMYLLSCQTRTLVSAPDKHNYNIVMLSRNHPLLMYLLSCHTRTLVSAPDKNNYNIVMLSRTTHFSCTYCRAKPIPWEVHLIKMGR